MSINCALTNVKGEYKHIYAIVRTDVFIPHGFIDRTASITWYVTDIPRACIGSHSIEHTQITRGKSKLRRKFSPNYKNCNGNESKVPNPLAHIPPEKPSFSTGILKWRYNFNRVSQFEYEGFREYAKRLWNLTWLSNSSNDDFIRKLKSSCNIRTKELILRHDITDIQSVNAFLGTSFDNHSFVTSKYVDELETTSKHKPEGSMLGDVGDIHSKTQKQTSFSKSHVEQKSVDDDLPCRVTCTHREEPMLHSSMGRTSSHASKSGVNKFTYG